MQPLRHLGRAAAALLLLAAALAQALPEQGAAWLGQQGLQHSRVALGCPGQRQTVELALPLRPAPAGGASAAGLASCAPVLTLLEDDSHRGWELVRLSSQVRGGHGARQCARQLQGGALSAPTRRPRLRRWFGGSDDTWATPVDTYVLWRNFKLTRYDPPSSAPVRAAGASASGAAGLQQVVVTEDLWAREPMDN